MKTFARIMLTVAAVFMAACSDPFEDFKDDADASVVNSNAYLSDNAESLGISLTSGFPWYGAKHQYRIETGFDDGSGTSGYWFSYDDSDDDGTSTITWPVERGEGIDSLSTVIDECGGLCFTITLGSGYAYPYAAVAFNVVNEDWDGADASSWGGLDVCYTSSYRIYLELAPEDEATVTEYDNYRYALPAASSETLVSIPWSRFSQNGWGVLVDIEDVVSDLALVKFQATQFSVGTEYNYNITAIGPYGSIVDCSGSVEESSSSTSSSSSGEAVEDGGEESSSSEALSFAWYGTSGSSRIETGFDDGTETSGYWYSYDDAGEDGTSTVTWWVDPSGSGIDSLDEVVEGCDGLCFTVTLGSGYIHRNAGVAFNVLNSSQEGANAGGWGGLDVCYTGDDELQIRLETEDEESVTEYNSYKVTLPAASSETLVSIPWSEFEQEEYWGIEVDLSSIYTNLALVKFQVSELSVGTEYNYNITAVGSYGSIASCP